ncbi:cytochrome P450 [Actinomadura keratinilytica]
MTRHEDVRAVLTHPRISANPDNEGFPNVGETMGVPKQEQIPGWFVGLDSPSTTVSARCSSPSSPCAASVSCGRDRADRGRADRRDAGRGNTADLVNDFALPVPSLVISSLLGVPSADRDFFESRTRTLVAIRTSTDEERAEATRQLLRYINRLIVVKKKWRGEDLISRLLSTGQLSDEELSGVLLLLLIAGHETTANNIGLGVVTLLSHREWIGNDRLVEELLRLHSVADMVALRVAVDDVEIASQTIRKGEGIVPLLASANHDTEAFGCPHAFNPERTERRHVAFGYGVHQCLGQNLVRVEMEIAYRKLFERIPTLRLAVPEDQLAYKYDGILFGLHELPVRW